MKKYNLSKIMKNAWALKKACELTFAECLKTAWRNEKEDAAKEDTAKEKRVVGRKIRFLELAKWVVRKMDCDTFLAFDAGIAVDDIILERETMKAIEVSTEWNGYRKKLWIPKSACEYRLA